MAQDTSPRSKPQFGVEKIAVLSNKTQTSIGAPNVHAPLGPTLFSACDPQRISVLTHSVN